MTRTQRKRRMCEVQSRVAEHAERQRHQEEVLLVVRDALRTYYDQKALTKTRVSKLLQRPESFVNYSLGGRNMTLRTFADLTLGASVEIRLVDKKG